MKKIFLFLLGAVLGLPAAQAYAQADTMRDRGTIAAVAADTLSLKSREGQDLKLALNDKTGYAYPKAIKLADIKAGDFVVATAVPDAEGRMIAREVRLFPEAARGTGEGHRPWDLEAGSTMTNASVSTKVQASSGEELTLDYKGGSRKILVPPGVPVVTNLPGDRSLLAVGKYVVAIVAVGADGKGTVLRIQVEKDGVRPPA